MANSAFAHEAAIIMPSSSTNTGIVTWSGTGANNFLDSTVLVSGNNITIPGTITFGGTQITSTAAELNLLDGVSGLVQGDFTKLAAVDSTAAELNKLSGASANVTAANLNALTGSGATALHSHSGGGGITVNGTNDNALVTYDNGNTRLNTESALTFDGSGSFVYDTATGSTNFIIHNSATSGSYNHSRLILRLAEANTTGDTYITFQEQEVYEWSMGVDNSDSNKFKISGSALGTNDKLTIATTGYGGEPLVSVGSAANNRFGFWTKNTQSVGTSLTYIINQSDNVTSGQGGLVFVCGRESSGSTKKFYDLLIHTYKDGGTVVTVGSGAENGASSRTYDENQGGLRLRMSSGTYDVAVWVLSAPNVE